MNVFGSFIYLLGVVVFLFGIVLIIWPIQLLGFSQRRDGVFVIFAALAVMFLGYQVSPELRQKAEARAAAPSVNGAEASTVEKPVSN